MRSTWANAGALDSVTNSTSQKILCNAYSPADLKVGLYDSDVLSQEDLKVGLYDYPSS